MPIFWPTSKPATLVTGTLVEPTGIVITGPSGRGCHKVVLLPAAVPMLAILRVSTLEPVSISIVSPTFIPAVLLTWMTDDSNRFSALRPHAPESIRRRRAAGGGNGTPHPLASELRARDLHQRAVQFR